MVIYLAFISHMQTNAEYVTTVTRMSVYYIQYEKNNKCMCYKSWWYGKVWESVCRLQVLHDIYVYVMLKNNGHHYVSSLKM